MVDAKILSIDSDDNIQIIMSPKFESRDNRTLYFTVCFAIHRVEALYLSNVYNKKGKFEVLE